MIFQKQTWNIVALLLATILFYACTKEQEKNGKAYYGELTIALANLPGTADVDVWFNDIKLGKVISTEPRPPVFYLKANETGKVSVYKSGTDTLIADTLISVSHHGTSNYKLANSEELGIKGWISTTPVAADSASFQLFHNLSAENYPVAAPDLYVCAVDPGTLEVTDTFFVFKAFKKGTLAPRVTVPQYDATGNSILCVGKLKDPATGLFIINKGLDLDLFPIFTDDFSKGTFRVLIVKDFADGQINIEDVPL